MRHVEKIVLHYSDGDSMTVNIHEQARATIVLDRNEMLEELASIKKQMTDIEKRIAESTTINWNATGLEHPP